LALQFEHWSSTIIQPQKVINAQATSTDQARDFTAASPARETEVLASPAPPRNVEAQPRRKSLPLMLVGGGIVALIVVGIIMAALTKTNTTTPYLNVDSPPTNSNAILNFMDRVKKGIGLRKPLPKKRNNRNYPE
jgi:hypothetical protein